MQNKDKFHFTMEERKKMIEEIQYFFQEERDENLGILASEEILDFMLSVIGDSVYNKALDDAQIWFKRNMENMEADFYAIYK